MTRKEKMKRYERMVAGEEVLESSLHLNLIDHLNAEIGLGTVTDVESAKRWLSGTFLSIRLKQNPSHYKLGESISGSTDINSQLEHICKRDIQLLKDAELIQDVGHLQCTEYGDAMSRYCVKFATMQIFLGLGPKSRISDILSAIAQAEEFKELRLRSGEKGTYAKLNEANGIRFPIQSGITITAHKISIIIQSELMSIDFPQDVA